MFSCSEICVLFEVSPVLGTQVNLSERVKQQPHSLLHLFVLRSLKHVPQQVSQLLIIEIQQLKGVNLWGKKKRTHD